MLRVPGWRRGAVLAVAVLALLLAAGCTATEGEAPVPGEDEGLTEEAGLGGDAGSGEGDGGEPALVGAVTEAGQQGEELTESPATFISLCVNCHDQLDRELDWRRQRKLIFDHQVHFANNIRCAACHHEFPHKPGYTIHVDVETCFLCHGRVHGPQGELAPTECEVCHTPDIAQTTPEHADPNWRLASGTEERAEHSQIALERPRYCRMCHENQFCLDCHGVPMPHGEEWLGSAHMETTSQEQESCSTCHRDEFCNGCHHVFYPDLPDWRAGHKTVVRDEGPDSCYRCHGVVSCEACHVETSRERGIWDD